MLEIGIKGEAAEVVDESRLALSMKSGALAVYATPAMIALMEQAAYRSVAAQLKEGQGTVGVSMNVKHLASTPAGMRVTAKSELTQIDRRKLTFHVEAYDESGMIGEGTHERFIIVNQDFQEKTDAKRT